MPSDRVSILRHAAAHPLPGVIDQDFAHFWHRRKIALVDAAPDPDPFALFRGRDAQFKHQDPVGGQSLHQPMHERGLRSEEHTSELQSLMRISYAVFCLKKNTQINTN